MMRPPRCFSIGRIAACAQRERRRQVGGEHRVPVLALHPHQQLIARDAGVVDQDVEPAVPLDDRARHAPRPPRGSVTSRLSASARVRPAVSSSAHACALSPRAAATTVAPCAASRAAIARPMPRDAPVTSATFPASRTSAHGSVRRRCGTSRGWPAPFDRRQRLRARRSSATCASRSILRTSPLSTVPGPTSTYVVTPSDARRRTTASQRTGADTCRTSASIAAARVALRLGVDVGHDRHARRRGPSARAAPAPAAPRPASSARNGTARSPASGIDALRAERLRALAGALDRGRARRRSPPARRRSGSPALTTSPSRRLRARLRDAARHRGPRIAAIAPSPDRHRLLHVPAAAAHRSAPRRRTEACRRRRCAEYSPRLWPATNAGAQPRDASRRYAAMLDGQDRGLRVLGQRELLLGAVEDRCG